MENKKLFFEQLISLLDTYTGRDKAIRTIYCSLALISTRIRDREKGEKLAAFAKQLSRARLVYRLFSQPSLIFSAIKIPQNWHNSTDKIETFFNTSTTLLYLFCGWTETIGWLSEAKILGRNSAKFFQLSLHLWVFALLTSITRCIRQIFIKIIQRKFFRIKDEFILFIALIADFIAAVNSLHKGILWAGKLNSSQNSLVFLIASIVGFYRLWK